MKKLLWMAGWLLLVSIAGLGRAYAVNDTARWEWYAGGDSVKTFWFSGNTDGNYRFAVDWGDGTVEEIEDVRQDTVERYYGRPAIPCTRVSHRYSREWWSDETVRLYPLDAAATLRHLDIEGKSVAALDVSQNVHLESLICYGNSLDMLDVSKNTALTALECGENWRIDTLDVSNNTRLTYLSCRGNWLTSLDVSRNVNLETLWCGNSQLTSLDVTKNTALTMLCCGDNQLSDLDLSNNMRLEYLECQKNKLESLDLSHNTALEKFWCTSNQLTSLDVSKNVKLLWLNCQDNRLTSLDVSNNVALTDLWCQKNQLTSLDVSKNVNLEWFSCFGNQLTDLDISQNEKLIYFDCFSNQLTDLDVSKNVNLTHLGCSNNRLTELDLTSCAALQEVEFSDNRLRSVTLSENAAVKTMEGQKNRLGLSIVYDLLSQRAQNATCTFGQQYDSAIVTVGMPFDLTSEMTISGAPTRYTVLNGETLHPVSESEYTFEDGIFRFSKPGSHYRLTLINDSVKNYNSGRMGGPVTFAWYIYVSGVANEDLASDEAATAPWAYVQGRTIYLTSDVPGEVEVFTAVGQRVYRGHDRAFTVPTAGVYVLRAADGRRCKVMVR